MKLTVLIVLLVIGPLQAFHDYCRLAPVTGPCKAYFKRYYYDPHAGHCKMFIYGGCGANANNFHTEGDCEEACH